MIKEDFAVIVPAFNEGPVIPELINELREAFTLHDLKGEVILVDDGSDDGTAQMAEEAAQGWDALKIVQHQKNLGKTESMLTGANTTSKQILALNPDGVFLSNGPGDPAAVDYGINTVKDLLVVKPIFGICLGHQILALALGGDTYKLKFGHRGCNHPVKNLLNGKIEITSQNHGFSVKANSLPKSVDITHLSLNDETVEGLNAKKHSAF